MKNVNVLERALEIIENGEFKNELVYVENIQYMSVYTVIVNNGGKIKFVHGNGVLWSKESIHMALVEPFKGECVYDNTFYNGDEEWNRVKNAFDKVEDILSSNKPVVYSIDNLNMVLEIIENGEFTNVSQFKAPLGGIYYSITTENNCKVMLMHGNKVWWTKESVYIETVDSEHNTTCSRTVKSNDPQWNRVLNAWRKLKSLVEENQMKFF